MSNMWASKNSKVVHFESLTAAQTSNSYYDNQPLTSDMNSTVCSFLSLNFFKVSYDVCTVVLTQCGADFFWNFWVIFLLPVPILSLKQARSHFYFLASCVGLSREMSTSYLHFTKGPLIRN